MHAVENESFSNSLIILQEKTKKITIVTAVWLCDPNYHNILPTLALNFSKKFDHCRSHKECFITYPNTLKSFKKTRLRIVFSNLLLSVLISDETLLFDIFIFIFSSDFLTPRLSCDSFFNPLLDV